MHLIDQRKEIRNSTILFLILGTLIIPVFNSIDNLIDTTLKVLGLSIMTRLYVHTLLQSVSVIGLFALLIWVIRSWNVQTPAITFFTLKNLRNCGLIFLALLIVSKTVRFLLYEDTNREFNLLEESQRIEILTTSVYWYGVVTFIKPLREILLFTIYFIILSKNR